MRKWWALVSIILSTGFLFLMLLGCSRSIAPKKSAQALYGQSPHVSIPSAQNIKIVCSSILMVGEAPKWVIDAWEGVVLQGRPITNAVGTEILSHKPVRVPDGYAVPWKVAMAALRTYGKHAAADWWKITVPKPPLELLFYADACREATS